MPVKTAFSAWAPVMAGPAEMSAVPFPMRRDRTPGVSGKSSTPMSTGTTRQFAVLAMWHTEVRPAARFSVTMAVTELGDWVTPWHTTPLSAHSTSTARSPISTPALPVRAAMSSRAVSSSPKPPRGLAQLFQWR